MTDEITDRPRAIETVYAGCLFRSRLEARWGVAFDALGERWLYEPQGFEITNPVSEDLERYLPDFYLPERRVWVEVKGSNDALLDAWMMLLASASPLTGLPADPDGSPVDKDGEQSRMLILGPVPKPMGNRVKRRGFLLLGIVDSGVVVRHCDLLGNSTLPVFDSRKPRQPAVVGNGVKLEGHTVDVVRPDFRSGVLESKRIDYALACARSARFEHGERPRVVPWRAGEEPEVAA